MVFLGHAEGNKAYRLYDPREDKVLVSRDVMFDEKVAWDWNSSSTGEAGGFTSTFVVEHLVIHGGGDAGEEVSSTPGGVPSTPAVEPCTPRECRALREECRALLEGCRACQEWCREILQW